LHGRHIGITDGKKNVLRQLGRQKYDVPVSVLHINHILRIIVEVIRANKRVYTIGIPAIIK
jgi:hypothetical protein